MIDSQTKNLCDGIKDAALTARSMDDMLRQCVTRSLIVFWHDCYPVLQKMVGNLVPQAMALHSIMQDKPHLRGREQDLIKAAVDAKANNPSGSYEENLAQAIKSLEESSVEL